MSSLAARMIEARLALALLTRLPAGNLPDDTPRIALAAWAFPLVGALVGALGGVVFCVAGTFLPALAAALLAVATTIGLTGALHEDGLADVADGFGGGGTRARKLEIMRDSRIGSYGVVALVLVLGLTASAIAAAPTSASTILLFAAIGAISRAAMALPMCLVPPARDDGLGKGAVLTMGWRIWTALLFAVLSALLTDARLLIAAFAATGFMVWWMKRQIGGQTGDTLGATQKVTECACWLVAAAQMNAS